MGDQARESAEARAEWVGADAFGLRNGLGRGAGVQQVVGVPVMDDIDAVPASRQGVRETLNEDGIAAEVIRWVEGRHHRETQAAHAASVATDSKTFRVASAVARQDKR